MGVDADVHVGVGVDMGVGMRVRVHVRGRRRMCVGSQAGMQAFKPTEAARQPGRHARSHAAIHVVMSRTE